jgi:uncharacterized protein
MVYLSLLILGVCAGFLSGLLGIGGGVVLVPALVLILEVPVHTAMGISLAVIVPAALSGFCKHFFAGNVQLVPTLIVAAGAIFASYGGATVATALSAETLRKLFGILLVLVGFNFLFGFTEKLLAR